MRGGRSLFIICCCLLAVMLAGCGDDSTSTTASTIRTTSAQSTSERRQTNKEAELEFRAQFERDFAPNPYREPKSPGAHPNARVDRLIVRDIKQGKGSAVRPGDSVWADFIESNWTNGRKFYWAWGLHRTGNLRLTRDSWMRGLILGMTGMRPGGRRVILVPRHLSDTEIGDGDRGGRSYREIVYWDVVLRSIGERAG
jgi:FKBP-type peptidyl-prolyl cis-trans isomerase